MMNEQILQISARIKELREILEMDVSEVAEALGISESLYLQYENGQDDIPISTLYGVAGIFGVDPTVILTGDGPKMESYTVIRQGKGENVERAESYKFTSLATNFIHRDMEPMIVEVKKHDDDEETECTSHGGQEFNYVLEGTMAVVINNKEIVLNQGDCIYFDPRVRHGQKAITDEAKFLCVINEWDGRKLK